MSNVIKAKKRNSTANLSSKRLRTNRSSSTLNSLNLQQESDVSLSPETGHTVSRPDNQSSNSPENLKDSRKSSKSLNDSITNARKLKKDVSVEKLQKVDNSNKSTENSLTQNTKDLSE